VQQRTDEEFLAAFEAAALSDGEFGHRDHVRATWILVRAYGVHEGCRRIAAGIRNFAAARGASGKYHETMTRAWARLVGAALRSTPGDDFGAFLDAHPELLDKELPHRHYRPETLASAAAKADWIEPDRAPLP
jgi:hypothetical protein